MQQLNYTLRELESKDFENGLLECFKELTIVGNITKEMFEQTFHRRKAQGIITIVAVEDSTEKILGTGSVMFEEKFIRSCTIKAYIEDVCVASYAQKKGVGKKIVENLRDRALAMGCYKVILTCSEVNEPFYKKLNFKKIEIAMAIYGKTDQ